MGEVEIESSSHDHGVGNKSSGNPEDQFGETQPVTTRRLSLVLFSLCVGLMLSMMDNSIVSTSLYIISIEFGSLAEGIWTILSYTLSYLGM